MDIMKAQLKDWFNEVKENRLNNMEIVFEEEDYKSEVAIIGSKLAGSIELGRKGVCDLSIIDIHKNEVIEFNTITFSDENELVVTLNEFISKIA